MLPAIMISALLLSGSLPVEEPPEPDPQPAPKPKEEKKKLEIEKPPDKPLAPLAKPEDDLRFLVISIRAGSGMLMGSTDFGLKVKQFDPELLVWVTGESELAWSLTLPVARVELSLSLTKMVYSILRLALKTLDQLTGRTALMLPKP